MLEAAIIDWLLKLDFGAALKAHLHAFEGLQL